MGSIKTPLDRVMGNLGRSVAAKRGIDIHSAPPNVRDSMPDEAIQISSQKEYLSDNCKTYTELELSSTPDKEMVRTIQNRRGNYRQPPNGDKPLDFFMTTPLEVAKKDDRSLMDVAVFGLGKTPSFKPIIYDLPDTVISVSGSNLHGMATIFDYDIVLFMVSYLNYEMEQVRQTIRRGEDSYLPPRTLQVPVIELLKAIRRKDSGNHYVQLEKALDRLSSTHIKIKEKPDASKTTRRIGAFNLIDGYRAVQRTDNGKISELSIRIPDWIYDGIVRTKTPTVSTVHPNYFLLTKGLHRFLYRMARKCAHNKPWDYKIETLYQQSGSTSPFRSFKADLKKAIAELQIQPLPDCTVEWIVKGKQIYIRFTYLGTCEQVKG